MPELPEVRALSERLDAALRGASTTAVRVLGFSALMTVSPAPDALVGTRLEGVSSQGKFLDLHFSSSLHVLVHLGQAGRVDLESPPRSSRGRGAVVRIVFDSGALFVREHGTERRAKWWVLVAEDAGPLAGLGPEPHEPGFADLLRAGNDSRHLHTVLRDQRVVAGIGRGYADDILHRARLSPFASLAGLGAPQREALLDTARAVLDEALEAERSRTGGLSEARLGARFAIHNRAGTPCPRCGSTLARVSYAA